MPVHQLLGGAVRTRLKVYGWVGGDRPADVLAGAAARAAQGFAAVKMNGTAGLGWVDARALLEDPWSTPVPELFRRQAEESAGTDDPWHFELSELTTPGVQCAVEAVARAGSAVAFLSARRDLRVRSPRLDLRDGEPVLVLDG